MTTKYLTSNVSYANHVVHNILWSYFMHLSYKTRKYKQKVYKSYFLAESYREGHTVKKRNLCPLGPLTETQRGFTETKMPINRAIPSFRKPISHPFCPQTFL